jgi:uncharacterized protein (DUF2141 family)
MSCFIDISLIGITGDCSNTNTGAFSIQIDGEAPGYSINWISPSLGTYVLTGNTYEYNGLSGGTYVLNVIDSCVPPNVVPYSMYISTGSCLNISEITDTTCGLDNGVLTASTSNFYGFGSFYLYENSTGYVTSGESFTNDFVFNNLSAGTYYVIGDDGGGCTGKSESCIIKSSTTMDFGFYVINNAGCGVDSGAIYITGLTGVGPYTYLWSNGSSTSSISGLTSSGYSVTITDSKGCILTKSTNVGFVPNVGIAAMLTTNPSCFSADGTCDVYVTGGTPPYYFSATNGTVAITFASNYVFTGVSAGILGVQVTDAGLCNDYQATSLLTPNSFSVVSVTTTNSICNNSSGTLSVNLFGSSAPYNVSLTDSSGNTNSVVISSPNYTFTNLSSGTYTLNVTDGGPCTFTSAYTISNTTLFTISTSITGTTCNNSDGIITVFVSSGGTPPYTYELNGYSIGGIVSTAYTFNNLSSGSYTVSVIDSNFCQQILPTQVLSSSNVDFVLASNSPITGSTGEITTLILDGEPPFNLVWSSNVNGQTGTTITGLTAGTYSLTITDDNGCVQTRTIDLIGTVLFSSYEVFNICNSDLVNSGEIIKKGPQQMLIEGFFDLTSGDTGCVLNTVNWEILTDISGITNSQLFYVSTSLTFFPSDNLVFETIKTLLESYYGIDSVEIDPLSNKITIKTICNPPEYLVGGEINVQIKITYSINCITCS